MTDAEREDEVAAAITEAVAEARRSADRLRRSQITWSDEYFEAHERAVLFLRALARRGYVVVPA